MALLSSRGISTPSLQAQGEQRRSSYFNNHRDIAGYKQADTLFQDIVDQIGATGDYSAGGVNTLTRYNVAEQGSPTATTSPTDLAIQGNGFFLVSNSSGATFLTRAGSFVEDASGNLVNAAGYTLMGYSLAPGAGGVTGTLSGLQPVNAKG
jgi:flagellar hook protein FlgE